MKSRNNTEQKGLNEVLKEKGLQPIGQARGVLGAGGLAEAIP